MDVTSEYEVEEILDSKLHRRKLKYLVKWKGYGSEENTWEPEENLTHAKRLIEEFHRRKPQAPRRIDMSQLRFREIMQDNIPVWVPRRLQGVLWETGKLEGLDRDHRDDES